MNVYHTAVGKYSVTQVQRGTALKNGTKLKGSVQRDFRKVGSWEQFSNSVGPRRLPFFLPFEHEVYLKKKLISFLHRKTKLYYSVLF
jgi:hypothetical protein